MTQIVLNVDNPSLVSSLKKVLSTMKGVSIASPQKLSSYEKSKMEVEQGQINTYDSVDQMFEKLGI